MYKELSVGSQELTMLKIMISLGLFDSYMTVNFFLIQLALKALWTSYYFTFYAYKPCTPILT